MKLNSKVTGGLAWAGLVVVLAVPSADILTKPQANSATITSDMDAIKTASITPAAAQAPKPAVRPVIPATRKPVPAEVAATPAEPAPAPTIKPGPTKSDVAAASNGNDVVEDYLASGKKLPSYISDAPAGTAEQQPVTSRPLIVPTNPATTTAKTPLVKPDGTFAGDAEADEAVTVATVPPTPYPASMRPKPTATAAAALPTKEEAPLIIDEQDLERRQAALDSTGAFGPEGSQQIITEDELEEWDSGSLADYLERKGLISESDRAAERLETQFDADGFFLSDGPNRSSAKRRRANDDIQFFFF